MSKVWEAGKGWYDTATSQKLEAQSQQQAPPAPSDMPGALSQTQRNPSLERRLPKSWVLAIYGIPSEGSGDMLRRKLCYILKSHGLQTLDSRRLKSRGGSAYIGPKNPEMDKHLDRMVKELEKKTGATDLVQVFEGEYDGFQAARFLDAVTRNALADLKDSEDSLIELRKAMVREVTILNSEGKEVNLVSSGYGRLETARRAAEEADSVLARFQGSRELQQEGERIRVRLEQFRAWTESVARGYEKFAKVERARQKAAGNAEVA